MQSLLCSSRKCFTFACMVHLLHYITSKEPIYLCKNRWKKKPHYDATDSDPWKNVGHADVLYPNYLKMVLFSNVTERQSAPHIYWKEPSNIFMLSYCTLKIENRFLWGLDRLPQESWFIHHHEWGYEALCLRVPCVCVIDDWFSCALLISYYT